MIRACTVTDLESLSKAEFDVVDFGAEGHLGGIGERQIHHLTDAHLGQIFLKHFQVAMQVYMLTTVMSEVEMSTKLPILIFTFPTIPLMGDVTGMRVVSLPADIDDGFTPS